MPHLSTQWKVWMTHPLSSGGADHRLQSQVCPTEVHLLCIIGRIWNVGEKGDEIQLLDKGSAEFCVVGETSWKARGQFSISLASVAEPSNAEGWMQNNSFWICVK